MKHIAHVCRSFGNELKSYKTKKAEDDSKINSENKKALGDLKSNVNNVAKKQDKLYWIIKYGFGIILAKDLCISVYNFAIEKLYSTNDTTIANTEKNTKSE